MSVPRIKYNHQGGDLVIEIYFKGLVAASYKYTVWKANGNEVMIQKSGNNADQAGEIYILPSSVEAHAGCLLDIHATIKGLYETGTEGAYEFLVSIKQDGNLLLQSIYPKSNQSIAAQIIVHQFHALLV